ncbi:hypothetical protein [Burkholderia pyrrocinia]|nr:hypothetical protein [Burkholderia pyrrocinia]
MGVLLGLGGAVLIALFGATTAGTKPYDPSLMASWVQAVGSVAAIVGAYWFVQISARDQRRLATKVRDRELSERRSSIQAVLDEVYIKFMELRRWYELENGTFPLELSFLSVDELASAASLLDDVPLFDFDSGELVKAILELRRACRTTIGLLERQARNFRDPDEDERYPGHVCIADQVNDEVDYIETVYFAALKVTGAAAVDRPALIRAFMWRAPESES